MAGRSGGDHEIGDSDAVVVHETDYNDHPRGWLTMERRRGARIPARFWVQISGVDDEPLLRRGDISMSGAYVELDQQIGPPGSVQRLSVAPHGKEDTVQLLARVVRVVSIQDLWHDGPGVAGVAFEFLPDAVDKREVLTRIIRHVMASKSYVAESVAIESGFEAQVGDAPGASDDVADDASIGVRVMVLETSWPVAVGDAIQCDIACAGRHASLSGRAVRTTEEASAAGSCFRVEVEFQRAAKDEANEEAAGRSISDAMDSLLEDVVFPAAPAKPARPRYDLSGSLERIRLGDLLAFLETERLSGVVSITRDASAAAIYVRDGTIIDVELRPGPDEPRDAIMLVCSFVTGEFEFTPQPIDRPDRVNATIAELLATPV